MIPQQPAPLRGWLLALGLASGLAFPGCARPPAVQREEPSPEVYQRAEAARVELLEREIARLNADVRAAEEALVAVESGLRGPQTRTQAVSMLAEARIEVDRAARRAPWRADDAAEAREKLTEAERQLGADHFGSAIFFVSRASRIASTLLEEADRVEATPDVRYLQGNRVNLRAAPALDGAVLAVLRGGSPLFPEGRDGEWMLVHTGSGQVGWIHESLVEKR